MDDVTTGGIFNREIETIKKSQMEMLQRKNMKLEENMMSEMKSSFMALQQIGPSRGENH